MHTFATRVLGTIVLFGVLLGLAPTSHREDGPSVVFEVWHDGGMRTGSLSGLVIAGWSDGVVVFAKDPSKPGQEFQTGNIAVEETRSILDELNNSGFFKDLKGGGTQPDATYTILTAQRNDKKSSYLWTERLDPPLNANIGSAPEVKAFARMWAAARTTLTFAYPATFVPLKERADIKTRYDTARARNEIKH